MKHFLLCLAPFFLTGVEGKIEAREWDYPMAPTCSIPCNCFEGFYLGVNLGAIGYICDIFDSDDVITGQTVTGSNINVIGGAQMGWDWQCNHLLFGLIADCDGSGAKAHSRLLEFTPNMNIVFDGNLQWFATLRGRMGMTLDRALFYVTGGAVAAGARLLVIPQDQGGEDEMDPDDTFSGSFRHTVWGLVCGLGAETLVCGNWSLSAEVLYMLFARARINTPVAEPFYNNDEVLVFTTSSSNFDFSNRALIGRIALNYRFR